LGLDVPCRRPGQGSGTRPVRRRSGGFIAIAGGFIAPAGAYPQPCDPSHAAVTLENRHFQAFTPLKGELPQFGVALAGSPRAVRGEIMRGRAIGQRGSDRKIRRDTKGLASCRGRSSGGAPSGLERGRAACRTCRVLVMTDPTDAANTGDSRPPAVSPPETDAPDVAIIARRVAAEAAPVAAASAEDVGAENALAVVRRLARTQQLPAELIAVLDGPLADAVAVAADYAGDAITATTRAAYLADWAEFAARCRAQQVDPTALPIHRVLVAAYLATLAGKIGRSALRRRVAAIVYHHRRRGLVWSSQQVAIRETRPMQGGSAPSDRVSTEHGPTAASMVKGHSGKVSRSAGQPTPAPETDTAPLTAAGLQHADTTYQLSLASLSAPDAPE
jgi:hypothetical protein